MTDASKPGSGSGDFVVRYVPQEDVSPAQRAAWRKLWEWLLDPGAVPATDEQVKAIDAEPSELMGGEQS
jgi:hypothetical protein